MDLITGPPSAEALATMAEIDGLRIEPVVLATQTGINGHLGPESAGAMLVLQGTFLDQERFNEFWMQVAELVPLLATAPGFIRRWAFADGPHYTFIAWWRSVADTRSSRATSTRRRSG